MLPEEERAQGRLPSSVQSIHQYIHTLHHEEWALYLGLLKQAGGPASIMYKWQHVQVDGWK